MQHGVLHLLIVCKLLLDFAACQYLVHHGAYAAAPMRAYRAKHQHVPAAQPDLVSAHHVGCAAQGLVKRFFNEKEVTSTLVMDALFSGCKQVEEASRAGIGPKVLLALPDVNAA